jgi:hypothetical protein
VLRVKENPQSKLFESEELSSIPFDSKLVLTHKEPHFFEKKHIAFNYEDYTSGKKNMFAVVDVETKTKYVFDLPQNSSEGLMVERDSGAYILCPSNEWGGPVRYGKLDFEKKQIIKLNQVHLTGTSNKNY